MTRWFRIALGLGLISYGLYSGVAWFYLGVIPLFFGITNWCPIAKRIGRCDGSTGCYSSVKDEATSTESQCCEQKGWSTEPKSECCSKK